MKKLFYTEIKNAQGEYEPLGVLDFGVEQFLHGCLLEG